MKRVLSLRSRIFLLVAALVATNLAGAAITLWYGRETQALFTHALDSDTAAFMAAEELVNELVMQKGFLTYYFLDSDPNWLKLLDDHHRAFLEWIKRARISVQRRDALDILSEIESRYLHLVFDRDQVVERYREDQRRQGAEQHKEVRREFYAILDLCTRYKQIFTESIALRRMDYQRRGGELNAMAWAAIPGSILFGFLLALVLTRQVLGPIRRLASGAGHGSGPIAGNEVQALSQRMSGLLTDVEQVRSKLEQSREHLQQSEKLALVGKLAAGVAHSVRNPLTSVKMRLFSLERGLSLNAVQREDFEVVSEEIRHIDTIVRNFLEFARPPKLKAVRMSPSEVVDHTVELLRHRLESSAVRVQVDRLRPLPAIALDPEQIKEALVNLMLNACEAMSDGGVLSLCESEDPANAAGPRVSIRVTDSGLGVAEAVREQIFEPFFSSKEEGSGLGLSISRRIVEEHGGTLSLEAGGGSGAAFVIRLPMTE